MADKKIILTKEEREQLEKEYRHLVDVDRPDVIEKLTLARSQGDLSENADYDAARDRQAQIEGRIQEIENILNNFVSADEVSHGKKNSNAIGIRDEVTFRDIESGEELIVKIVGNIGADPTSIPPTVSNESPIGKALLGHVPGDTVTVEAVEPYQIEIIKSERK